MAGHSKKPCGAAATRLGTQFSTIIPLIELRVSGVRLSASRNRLLVSLGTLVSKLTLTNSFTVTDLRGDSRVSASVRAELRLSDLWKLVVGDTHQRNQICMGARRREQPRSGHSQAQLYHPVHRKGGKRPRKSDSWCLSRRWNGAGREE